MLTRFEQAGNEPDIFAPWEFNWAGRLDLTQQYVRKVLRKWYPATPKGVPGNDDYGTLSAWSVWAYLGMYPRAGDGTYVFGSPMFANVSIHRSAGDIVIVGHNASDLNMYSSAISIDGKKVPLNNAFTNIEQLKSARTVN